MKKELVNSEKQSRFFFLQVNAIRLRRKWMEKEKCLFEQVNI